MYTLLGYGIAKAESILYFDDTDKSTLCEY